MGKNKSPGLPEPLSPHPRTKPALRHRTQIQILERVMQTLSETILEIKALARSGLSSQEISDRTGLALGGIHTVLGLRRGPSPPQPGRAVMSDEQFMRACAPHDYRHKQLEAKLDRIMELLEGGTGA